MGEGLGLVVWREGMTEGRALGANDDETPPMTPVHYEGDEVKHHDDELIERRTESEREGDAPAVFC